MVEVVRALDAVLLRTGKTELAPPTDAAREADPDQPADFQAIPVRDVRAQCDDLPDPLVAADVRQLDFCYRVAIGAGGCAGFGVEVWIVCKMSVCQYVYKYVCNLDSVDGYGV